MRSLRRVSRGLVLSWTALFVLLILTEFAIALQQGITPYSVNPVAQRPPKRPIPAVPLP